MPTSFRQYPAFTKQLLPAEGAGHRIVVLGAGMAGLAAAYQLVQAGHDVVVLEARREAGGRVRTLRAPFVGGMHAEAGAMFLHGHHTLTMGYAALLDLPLVPIPHGRGAVAVMRGRRLVAADRPTTRWPVTLDPREPRTAHALIARYIVPVVRREMRALHARRFPTRALRHLDDMTTAEFLRHRGASAGAIEILSMGYLDLMGEGIHAVSALTMLRDLTASFGAVPHTAALFGVGGNRPDPFDHGVRVAGEPGRLSHADIEKGSWMIQGGNDRLPRALADTPELRSRMVYRAEVVRLAERGATIRVSARTPRGVRHWSADAVICTIPFSVLRDVALDVPLADAARDAIATMRQTSVVRQYVQLPSRPWRRVNPSGVAVTDTPVMYVNDQSCTQPGPRGILESYSAGRQARWWMSLPATERRRELDRQLDQVYPRITRRVLARAVMDWDADPHARGAYAAFEPGMLRRQLPALSGRHGRLWFAGDALSRLPGWIQGALERAHEVAEAVHRASRA